MQFFAIMLFTLSSLFSGNDGASIVFAGDAMQHQAQIDAAKKGAGVYDYSGCFDAIAPYVDAADYAVVNLETPLGGAPYTGYPCFSAPDSYLDALTDAGFDLMLTANNHTLDKRDKGLVRTLDRLDAAGVDHIGTYRNSEERDSVLPLLRDINGFNVAFLNYTYGTNGISLRTAAVVDYIDRELIKSDIAKARSHGAEIVAVCIHWGIEYELLPSRQQKQLADFLVDSGADLVIGGHPHVVQPMEMRRNADGKKVLVVYSLGNFISNMKTRDTRGGAMLKVGLTRDADGIAAVDTATYRLVFAVPPVKGSNFRLVPAEKCDVAIWKPHCKAFEQAAENLFDKHNVGVSRDTTLIPSEKMSPIEIFLHKTFGTLQK